VAVSFRFVLVGSGNIANTYVQALRGVKAASLVAVVSRSGARPTRMASGESVEVKASLRDVTSPFDAVILATPPGLHHQGALEAAALGRHVLTEKPLAITTEGADQAIAACRSAGVTLGCCYQRRLSPDNASVRKMVVEGTLGRVLAADLAVKFYRGQDYYDSGAYRGTWTVDGGGAFMQQASHQADLYGWFFGRPALVRAAAGTLAHRMESEDHGAAILVHDNGMIGTFVASTVARPGFPPRLEIHAEAGSVVLENDTVTHWLVPDIPNPSRPSSEPIHSGAGAGGAAVADTSGHEAILTDFIRAVREHRPPVAGGEEARLATELIVEIYRAAGIGP
jgi:UDP-N-acetyl-2-amino-2-deoxyglucuronate dehydrogenase